MSPTELAARLHGREYGEEMNKVEEIAARDAGLVVIFGASDDLIELRGAINDEVGGPGSIYLHRGGLLDNPDEEECERCTERLVRLRKQCARVVGAFDANGWIITSRTPHAAFSIMEDRERFCLGAVIAMADLPLVEGVWE